MVRLFFCSKREKARTNQSVPFSLLSFFSLFCKEAPIFSAH